MEGKPSRSHLKRSLPEDDDSDKPPAQKRVRFPKGKKVKPGNEKVDVWKHSEDATDESSNPRLAANERAMRRNQIAADLLSEENRGMLHDISAAEVHYEDNEMFIDDGIQIEPFNLEKEREEGYFDEQGNFVEYVDEDDVKDAWLDSVEVDPRLAERGPMLTNNQDDIQDLLPEDIAKMKRRIADVLEPGETVLQALRRLKGTSNRKEKMSAEKKLIFDQLTEDAMKLMENGDYNVYDEKQGVFEREAEGYERLVQARGENISTSVGQGMSHSTVGNDFMLHGTDSVGDSSQPIDTALGPSNLNVPSAEILSSNGDETFDMFAEEDEHATANPTSSPSNLISGANHDRIDQSSKSESNFKLQSVAGDTVYSFGLVKCFDNVYLIWSAGGGSEDDYVFDESSGYYYNTNLGYYYDPSTGFYCCAASGQWYSYNEATGAYDEVKETASEVS